MLVFDAYVVVAGLIGGVVLDWILGEPRRFHPLVGFGAFADKLESGLRITNSSKKNYGRGGAALFLATIPITLLIVALALLPQTWWLHVLALYLALGYKSLRQHVAAVHSSLTKDLPQARTKLQAIVSRNTSTMDEPAVVRATIETTLENFSDAVIAPLFWFVLLGAPGAIFYRLCNTLDAMWGYRSARYRYFGFAAAKLDDALNYIPARLVACSFLIVGKFKKRGLNGWIYQSGQLASPNAGVVMACGGGMLNVKLGGPAEYDGRLMQKPWFGGDKEGCGEDVGSALSLCLKAYVLVLAIVILGCLMGAGFS